MPFQHFKSMTTASLKFLARNELAAGCGDVHLKSLQISQDPNSIIIFFVA